MTISKLALGFAAAALSGCATTHMGEQPPECPHEVRNVVGRAAQMHAGISRSTSNGQAIELELKSGQRCVVSFP